jgi:hypothetical protein
MARPLRIEIKNGWRKANGAMLAKRWERLRGYRWSSDGASAGCFAAPAGLGTVELWRRAGGRDGYGKKWADFANRHGDAGLAMTLYLARRCTGLTLRELGVSAGGMDYSAVAATIRRFEKRVETEKPLSAQARAILNEQ